MPVTKHVLIVIKNREVRGPEADHKLVLRYLLFIARHCFLPCAAMSEIGFLFLNSLFERTG
jgi:hypothetical protein